MKEYPPSKERDKAKTDIEYAQQWLTVTGSVLAGRIAELKELGNHEAARELEELYMDTLNMLKDGVANEIEGFIKMLSDFEKELTSDMTLERPSHGTYHAMQLDGFVDLVRRAQAVHGS